MTTNSANMDWLEANHLYLTSAIDVVRRTLEGHLSDACHARETRDGEPSPEQTMLAVRHIMDLPPALESLCTIFGLSPFERDVLLLCAGVELSTDMAPLCGAVQGDPDRQYPTFSLALAVLSDAHWTAISPAGPLRQWRLVEVHAGSTLMLSPLRIDERILHFLTGLGGDDEPLMSVIEPLRAPVDLVASHSALAERIATAWTRATGHSRVPVVQLSGNDIASKRAVVALAGQLLGLGVSRLPAHFIPANPCELDALVRLWRRESALKAAALLVDCDELEASDGFRAMLVEEWIDRAHGLTVISSREPRHAFGRVTITLEVRHPTAAEQRMLWHRTLGEAGSQLNGEVKRLAEQFTLSEPSVRAACATAMLDADRGDQYPVGASSDSLVTVGDLPCIDTDSTDGKMPLAKRLWDACRVQTRTQLDNLAQRIEPAAGWADLIMAESQRETLRQIAAHVRHRSTVYETWEFASKGSRGLGISALFAGASGTGKTMAAEVLAAELRLDLYRIDLSAVVSKYIGETEKNLRRVFDAAEQGGSILLFDEADALFGKRSEVKDSHDRYANIEVGYLLQRIESYRGLAILTSNMKSSLDTAFLRRIRFIVPFPFPDAVQRAHIWRRIFPASLPTEGLDMVKLSRLNVSGGHIRNIALNAAFLAAEAAEPVRMNHLLRAARIEYTKIEQPLTESEIGGWI